MLELTTIERLYILRGLQRILADEYYMLKYFNETQMPLNPELAKKNIAIIESNVADIIQLKDRI